MSTIVCDGRGFPSYVAPHAAPNVLDPHMTRYDYDYNRGLSETPLVPSKGESGHSINRPLFSRPGAEDWTTSHQHFHDRKAIVSPAEAADVAVVAAKSRILNTAHIRGSRSRAGVPWNELPTASTYKDHFPPKWSTPSNGGAMYAGSRTTQYNPNFLSVDTPEDTGVGRPKKGRFAFLPPRPATVGNPVRRSGHLSVFGAPSADGQPWTTEYSTVGNPKLFKACLLPRGFGDATGCRSDEDKLRVIDSLAGRRHRPRSVVRTSHETNPITMNQKQMDRCQVAWRHAMEGPVHMPNHQSDMIRRTALPELADPPQDKGTGLRNVVLAKGQPVATTDTHPSIVRRDIRRGNMEIPDRHVHKQRARSAQPKL